MRYVLLLSLVVSLNLNARESWLCTEDSSQIQGSNILACGVGEAENESMARKLAFESAEEEFNSICDFHTVCGKFKYSARPSRSTCERLESGTYKCHRLIVYEVNEELRLSIERQKEFNPVETHDITGEILAREYANKVYRFLNME